MENKSTTETPYRVSTTSGFVTGPSVVAELKAKGRVHHGAEAIRPGVRMIRRGPEGV